MNTRFEVDRALKSARQMLQLFVISQKLNVQEVWLLTYLYARGSCDRKIVEDTFPADTPTSGESMRRWLEALETFNLISTTSKKYKITPLGKRVYCFLRDN